MKKLTFALLGALTVMIACHLPAKNAKQNGDAKSVPFAAIQNYFVKDAATLMAQPKMETQESFDQVFGGAAVMGPNGSPTAVDFSKQFVISVALPATDMNTQMNVKSLTKAGDVLTLSYTVTIGEKMTYTMQPFIGLVVDKAYNGKVVVQQVK